MKTSNPILNILLELCLLPIPGDVHGFTLKPGSQELTQRHSQQVLDGIPAWIETRRPDLQVVDQQLMRW